MSNFNEEMEQEFAELQLEGRAVDISEEDKGTYDDYARLEAQIILRTEDNRSMLVQSEINAGKGSPLGNAGPMLIMKPAKK